jgi:hypothetical protein
MEKNYNIIIRDNANNSNRVHISTSESDLFQYIGTMLEGSEEVKAIISVGSDGLVNHEEIHFAGRFELRDRVIYDIKNPDGMVKPHGEEKTLEEYLFNGSGEVPVPASEPVDESEESSYPMDDEDFPSEPGEDPDTFRNKWS